MAEVEKNVTNFPIKVGPIASSAKNAQKAEVWAEGTDEQVEELGGTHSAKGWAESIGNNYMPKSGGTFTGDITIANNKKINFQHFKIEENNVGNPIIGDGNGNGLVISKNGTGAALFANNGSSYTDLIKRTDVKSTYSSTGLDPVNGTAVASAISGKQDALPSGTPGQYLQKTSEGVQWAGVDALPSQTGNSGKFLTTNGNTASWATVSGGIPTLTWFTDNTGTTLNTGLNLSSANLVKVYKNGLLLREDADGSFDYYTKHIYTGVSGSYLQLVNRPAFDTANTWSVEMHLSPWNPVGMAWPFGNSITDDCTTPGLGFENNSLHMFLSSNGSSWDIADASTQASSTPSAGENWIKMSFDGSHYKLQYRQNTAQTWVTSQIIQNSNKVYVASNATLKFLNRGSNVFSCTGTSLILEDLKITLDDVLWFNGATAELNTDYTNTSCILSEETIPLTDYYVSSNSIVFSENLSSNDKIAVEVY